MRETSEGKDINETQQPEAENYKDIKTEKETNPDEARSFWDALFSEEVKAEPDNQDNPRQEIIDGKKYYYDDNGKLYRVENELAPNTEYEINGYKYKTDELGRIISAEGTLRMKDPDYTRNMENVRNYESQEYRDTDDRGHLIAHQFGGSDRLENLVPQDSDINQKDFKDFENELAGEVKKGKKVTVMIEPIYEGDSSRPVAIVVTYSIDGEESIRVFPNGQEE